MFLLFDEFPATDGVETGGTIQRVLTEELAECTVLLIAHRVQTLEALCTRVVVIDNGTVSQVLDMKSRTTRRAAMKKKLESLVE
ncbi:hypothetical protein DQ04_08681020 [Trypanosoma grayi]|uniref:hypothetical protein n=1 Tax=Trypanosoma grayi TaxID=71804 RepID=UPI0004F45D57|nr:hypothetical protein DQ04_08681020 [Trypanosoma grayi]KEG07840.1 hypothetical protein DQ04_08681020 [Trypanosoma grayi]